MNAATKTAQGTAILHKDGTTTTLAFLESGIIRLAQTLDEEPLRPSFAVVDATLSATTPTIEETTEGAIVRCGEREVRLSSEGGFEISERGQRLFAAPSSGDLRRVREGARFILESPAKERIHGLGEKTGHLDKRGQVLRLWNKDHWLYDRTSDPIYKSIPFWIGLQGARAQGVFVDDPGEVVLDFGATEPGFIRITVRRPALDLWLIPGPSAAEVLERYTRLTGRPAMPPHWALGFHQCRYSYPSSQRVREVAAAFRRKDIACDAIWLDIHHQDGFKSFTSCPHHFHDLEALARELHAAGFRVVAIEDPGLRIEKGYAPYVRMAERGLLVRRPNGEIARYEVWPGDCAFPDFFRTEARALWGEFVAQILDRGIDGIWNDMNEPAVFGGPGQGTFESDVLHETVGGVLPHAAVHNAYGHEMARATREAMEAHRKSERPFVLTRAAYAGSQRYAASWSGDNDATFDDLRLSLTMALNMGMSGFPMYGPDIGGYAGAPTPELMTRWLQLGAFFGLMRVHAMIGTPDQEPWSFGHDAELRHQAAIAWRYRLLPLTISLHWMAARTGMPPMRPLWTEWPEHEALSKREDLFLYGPDLLVAPVLVEGQRLRTIPVPPGLWLTFPSGQPVPQNRSDITLEGRLEDIPMLVRAGAFVPLDAPRASTAAPRGSVARVRAFPGGSRRFEWTEDDGLLALGQHRERTITLESQAKDRSFAISASAPTGDVPGAPDMLIFEIPALGEPPLALSIDGQEVGLGAPGAPLHWDGQKRELLWTVPVNSLPRRLHIDLARPIFQNPATRLLVPRARGGGGTTLDLSGPAHRLAAASWTPKRVEAIARLEWEPSAIHLVVAVRDDAPGPACANPQEDGLCVVLQALGRNEAIRYRLAVPEEGGGVSVLRGRGFIPTQDVEGQVEREGGRTRYALKIPAAAFGLLDLQKGSELSFDLCLQHSDRTGRRAMVEWVQAITRSWAPGGRLVLTDG